MAGEWQEQYTDFEEVVKLDTQYIREWSVKGNVKIIFQTLTGVLRKWSNVRKNLILLCWTKKNSIKRRRSPIVVEELCTRMVGLYGCFEDEQLEKL